MSVYDHRFDGRRAVVTGGAQGIGFAIAQRLAREGARLSLWDADGPALEAAAAALEGVAVDTIVVDITDAVAVESAAARTAQAGAIDVLVHSAGIAGPTVPVVDYPLDAWRSVVDIDLTGAFHVNQAVVKRMIGAGYGRIVNIASIAGKEGNPNASAYSAAKGGQDPDPGAGVSGAHRLHAVQNPARAVRHGRGDRGARVLPGLGGELLHDRSGLRHLRGTRHLLARRRSLGARSSRRLNAARALAVLRTRTTSGRVGSLPVRHREARQRRGDPSDCANA